jgi:glycosyltransferase involved in cell wall biosynthesis
MSEKINNLRVAIVHHWLIRMRGGEKVLEALCELFPQAVIYTHVVDKSRISPALLKHEIRTTFIQKLPKATRHYQKYVFLMPLALEQLDLREFDLVISIESGPSKGVITRSDCLHICYCNTPMRYLWDFYQDYLNSASPLIRLFMIPLFHKLRIWDVTSANRVDYFIANSETIRKRITKWWRRESEVIYPPVSLPRLESTVENSKRVFSENEEYYLYLGALVQYKRADLAVQVCTELNKNLVVIGEGNEKEKLKAAAGPNVKFLGFASDGDVQNYLAHCKALLFPGEEDFGIVPLEAQAFGRPVIAYNKGGATETVSKETGVFFDHQTKEDLAEAIRRFEKIPQDFWNLNTFKEHVAAFSKERFIAEIKSFVEQRL